MKRSLIIGFGRFGQLLAGILKPEFEISILESDKKKQELATDSGYKSINIEQISEADYIFLAIPISQTEEVIRKIKDHVNEKQLVMDVCSVKVYPANLMQKHLGNCQLLATHPMFGPDSAKNGLTGLKLVLCPLKVSEEVINFWKNFWESRGVQVIITTPEKHDKESVYSQAFTYTLAKMVNLMEIPDIQITTKSFEAIKRVAEFSANDSSQLFHDMLFYNPYFKEMKVKFKKVIEKTEEIMDRITNESMDLVK